MARITEMYKKWLKQPKYKKAYDALEEEFVLVQGAVMDVRQPRRPDARGSCKPGGWARHSPWWHVLKAVAPGPLCERWNVLRKLQGRGCSSALRRGEGKRYLRADNRAQHSLDPSHDASSEIRTISGA